jgi:hypothetical protein
MAELLIFLLFFILAIFLVFISYLQIKKFQASEDTAFEVVSFKPNYFQTPDGEQVSYSSVTAAKLCSIYTAKGVWEPRLLLAYITDNFPQSLILKPHFRTNFFPFWQFLEPGFVPNHMVHKLHRYIPTKLDVNLQKFISKQKVMFADLEQLDSENDTIPEKPEGGFYLF